MSFQHGKSSVILVNEFNLSAYFRGIETGKSVESHDTTVFGQGSKTYLPGLKDGTLSLDGLWDGASGAIDEKANTMLGSASGQLITVAPAGFAVGNRCDLLASRFTSYNVSDPVGDLVSIALDCQADGGIDGGVCLNDLATAVVAAGNGSNVDNGAATTNGYSAILHVVSFTGTTATIKAQHSTDGSTFSDLATFTAATAATSERKTGTGTVNRYLRYNIAGTFTSITFALALARR